MIYSIGVACSLRRLKVFAMVLLFLLLVFMVGAFSPMERTEAQRRMEEAQKILPREPNIQAIFSNNLRVALLMLIPVLGLILGSYSLYNTGLYFSATSVSMGVSSGLLLLAVILQPFFWLEFVAYALSMTQNLYLTGALVHRRIRGEVKPLILVVALLAAILLVGAAVEVLIINLLR